MARFTYEPEYDTHGNLLGTTIKETSGYFAGYTPEQLSKLAESHFPNYQSFNLTETFWAVYFNHTLRKVLHNEESMGTLGIVPDPLQCSDSLRDGEQQGPDDTTTSGQSEGGSIQPTGD